MTKKRYLGVFTGSAAAVAFGVQVMKDQVFRRWAEGTVAWRAWSERHPAGAGRRPRWNRASEQFAVFVPIQAEMQAAAL